MDLLYRFLRRRHLEVSYREWDCNRQINMEIMGINSFTLSTKISPSLRRFLQKLYLFHTPHFYNEFKKTPRNDLIADTTSQTDGWTSVAFSLGAFLSQEHLKKDTS
jgi:hypothetical protein